MPATTLIGFEYAAGTPGRGKYKFQISRAVACYVPTYPDFSPYSLPSLNVFKSVPNLSVWMCNGNEKGKRTTVQIYRISRKAGNMGKDFHYYCICVVAKADGFTKQDALTDALGPEKETDTDWDDFNPSDFSQLQFPMKPDFYDSPWVQFHWAALRQRHWVLENLI